MVHRHFMIGEQYKGTPTDGGRDRWFTVEAVDLPSDGETGGLLLTGKDVEGWRCHARTEWTHAVYVRGPNDPNGNPRRGWKIMDGDTVLRFVDEGHAGTLTNATGDASSPYPYALGSQAPWMAVTARQYQALRKLSTPRSAKP